MAAARTNALAMAMPKISSDSPPVASLHMASSNNTTAATAMITAKSGPAPATARPKVATSRATRPSRGPRPSTRAHATTTSHLAATTAAPVVRATGRKRVPSAATPRSHLTRAICSPRARDSATSALPKISPAATRRRAATSSSSKTRGAISANGLRRRARR